jgi:signal transduction histidine kinase
MDVKMDQLPVVDGNGLLTRLSYAAGAPRQDERAAQRLLLLNALLMVSLEDITLERQLLSALDLLLTVPWFPLQPQAAVFLVGDDPKVLEMAASRGLPEAARAGCARVPFGRCICGRVAASGESGFTACANAHPEVPCDAMPAHGYYSVVLRQQGKVLGILALYLKEGRRTDPEEAEFLEVIASTLVGIVARSQATAHIRRLLTENRQLNQRLIALQEEEYRHLARELHDEIGQSVAAIKTEVVLLPQARADAEVQRGVQAIGAAADRIYETMHEMVGRLRPGVLDDLGLLAAIEAQVADWQRLRPGLLCRLDVHGRFDDLDEPTRITVYRFVQECLTNIVRHAAATEVKISLARDDCRDGVGTSPGMGEVDHVGNKRSRTVPGTTVEVGAAGERTRGQVVLCVGDNGRGMDVTRLHERNGRFGLLGMRERVEGLGGTLTIEGGPGQGCWFTARIPVPERRMR